MANYKLTKAADSDLESIAHYTISEWGIEQARRYVGKLDQCFQNIGAGEVFEKRFSHRMPQVYVTRCEHHYIFYLAPGGEQPIVIAVLHERMDMIACLKARL